MKVSVIIPCYNAAPHIERCVNSIFNQDYSNLEIICVNDGSTDETAKILEQLKEKSKFPFTIISQENKGVSNARNRGVEASAGDYIQFIDADDWLNENKVSHQIKFAAQNEFPDLIVGSYRRRNILINRVRERQYIPTSIDSHWLMLMKTDFGFTCSNLFKQTMFKEGLKWDEEMRSSEEYRLMFEILKRTQSIVFDDEILTEIECGHDGSISETNKSKMWLNFVNLRFEMLQYIAENETTEEYKKGLQVLFDAIRILYQFDSKLAINAYEKMIPKSFLPSVSSATGNVYVKLYKLFGFKGVEKFRSLFLNKRVA